MALSAYFLYILVLKVSLSPIATLRLEDEIAGASQYYKNGAFKVVKNLLQQFYQLSSLKHGLKLPQMDTAFHSMPQFDDGTELTKNREIVGELFENDVVLTIEQAQNLLKNFGRSRSKRKIISGTNYKWPGKTIPYRFQTSDTTLRRAVQDGIRQWEENTCLKFQENGPGNDHILFMKGSGCYSSVGRTGGAQQLSIADGCEKTGIVAHEIGHSLGFWHEQSRSDRDNYISIQNQNIIPGTHGNFERRATTDMNDYGVPYDLGSVMHYGPKAFVTSTSVFSINTNDQNYQNTIGQRQALSFIDIKQINVAYCADVCPRLSCRHGGYANPKNCTSCKCPSGLAGSYCDRAAQSDSGCGEDLTANGQWKTIQKDYRGVQICNWLIRAPSGSRIIMEVSSLEMPCSDTCDSFLEIKYNREFQQTGARFCCQTPRTAILSETEEMVILYRTDGTSGSYSGFNGRFKIDGPTGLVPRPPTPTAPPPRPQPKTLRPPPAPRPPSSFGQWGSWASWSPCSVTCGGCGFQTRRRDCSGRCSGDSLERQQCGEQICPGNQQRKRPEEEKCQANVRIPCYIAEYLMKRGHFNPTKSEYHVNRLPPEFHGTDAEFINSSPHRFIAHTPRGKRDVYRNRYNRYYHNQYQDHLTNSADNYHGAMNGRYVAHGPDHPPNIGGRRPSSSGERGATNEWSHRQQRQMCSKTVTYACSDSRSPRFHQHDPSPSERCCSGYDIVGNVCMQQRSRYPRFRG